ncbi:hypothetical protein CCACVL1_27756 [Corchorus capsularis]|uniref:Uncharacterized protein n=1 Tax=Corchorus capsularis TaxID=210143 RepID=A0A1R3G8U3_COCAP|nr:hypothetical protein CCACVL1_27756 [Corchorus capsularis]
MHRHIKGGGSLCTYAKMTLIIMGGWISLTDIPPCQAKSRAMREAAEWRRLQGISKEGDDELLAEVEVKALPTWDEWMTTLPRERKGKGEHGKDVQGLQGSMEMHEDHGDIDKHVPSTKKMSFDPLKMPISPMTRARAKRFKDALMGLVRTHLIDMKTIEVQLMSFDYDLSKKIPINYKFTTLLAIDSTWPD